jgi:integrase/recombinase XerD
MRDQALLGPWVRRFLLEHVVAECNLACNTRLGYRDALTLLIPFVSQHRKTSADRLDVVDVSADLVRQFLAYLETSRGCSVASRNQRLAAIRALARFIGANSPTHIQWCGQIRLIPFKKVGKSVVPCLEKLEMDALLAAPNRKTPQGRRDYTLLLFLYNVGARATEAAQLKVDDVDLRGASVRISGKGETAVLPVVEGHRCRA